MFKCFYPYDYVESVFAINYSKLYDMRYRGIIFDIDNTLVHHGDDSTPKVDNLLKTIKSIGFKTLLLSNNNNERVQRFIKNIDTLYICDAEKPNPSSYLKAVEMLNMNKEEVLFIGDQIFTDILGANRSGIASILVKYIQLKEETKTGKRRFVENIILKFYKKNRKFTNRFGDIYQKEDNE